MTVTQGPLHSANYTVSHAKRRVEEFRTILTRWERSSPYKAVIQLDPDPAGPYDIHKVKQVKPIPKELPGIALDIVNSLRSSLDHACYAIAAKSVSGKVKDAHFPFGQSATDIEARRKARSKDIPKDIFDFIKLGFKPYQGGNDTLFGMNQLCNTKKHNFIIPMACFSFSGRMGIGRLPCAKGGYKCPPEWDRSKNEAIVCIAAFGEPVSYNLEVIPLIALAEPKVFDGKPALAVFNEMVSIVEGIVLGLEAESRRLGIFN